MAEDARTACAAASFWLKTRLTVVHLNVSGRLPREVTARRNVDSHRGTAFGNCRSVDIAAMAAPRSDTCSSG